MAYQFSYTVETQKNRLSYGSTTAASAEDLRERIESRGYKIYNVKCCQLLKGNEASHMMWLLQEIKSQQELPCSPYYLELARLKGYINAKNKLLWRGRKFLALCYLIGLQEDSTLPS